MSVPLSNKTEKIRYRIGSTALGLASFSVLLVLYLKTVFVFQNANFAQVLETTSFFGALAAIVLGVVSFRCWQGIVATLLAGFALCFILFGPLWAIS